MSSTGETPAPRKRPGRTTRTGSTGGRALAAATGEELSRVDEDLGRSVEVEMVKPEVTDWFTAAAAALAFLGAVGSLVWFGRLP